MKSFVFLFLFYGFSGNASDSKAAAQDWLKEFEGQSAIHELSLLAQSGRQPAQVRRRGRRRSTVDPSLRQALTLAKEGKYEEASMRLFRLSRSPRFRGQRTRIKYILGLMLFEMDLKQISAFQFVNVIRSDDRKYIAQSLEKLSLAADELNDDTLLNYAISRIEIRRYPPENRDMLYFRIGELQMRNRDFSAAARSFARVPESSRYFGMAKYNQALSFSERGQLKRALRGFGELILARANKNITDTNRVAANLGRARVLYQMKRWDDAITVYRQIPRDTEFWHDVLFEQSWAMMRSARFRSALSNFHSLHSPYYEDFYLPESLLLRAIVYLYICKYDEMEKVIHLFEKTYKPVRAKVLNYLRTHRRPEPYFEDIHKTMSPGSNKRHNTPLPYIVARHIANEGDFRRTMEYYESIEDEKYLAEQMSVRWQSSSIGKYSSRILNMRLENTKRAVGRIVRAHLIRVTNELRALFEQNGLLRFEMFNGRKENIKKRIAGQGIETQQVDADSDRDFYIQNGFEYWPFQGEYWLDELGNYHYVGVQACQE